MKTILNYFFRGLLFVAPLFFTLYVLVILVNWLNHTLNVILFNWLPVQIPGLGILTAFFAIALLGFAISFAITRPLFSWSEAIFARIPIFKIVYTAFKDFMEAFVGEKKKFNRPVIVQIVDGVDRIGFLTEENLSLLQIEERVAVYFPHSYNFSGNLFLVHPDKVTPIDVNPADAMKFAVSAGVTHIEENSNSDQNV